MDLSTACAIICAMPTADESTEPFKPMGGTLPAKTPPLPLARYGPHLIHIPSTDPTHHSKGHPDPISHFSTAHSLDRQTDRGQGQQTCKNIHYALLYW